MNPYALVDDRQRRARGVGFAWLGPVVGAVVTTAVLPASFYHLGRDVPAGVADVAARIGTALAAGLALGTYSAVVRGPDRGVIDLHPLREQAWYAAKVRSVLRGSVPWLLGGWILLVRLPEGFLAAATIVTAAWLAGIGIGLGVNLAAPAVGLDPRWAGVLDAVRGKNPRLQAALLYAPGIALTVAGISILVASQGVRVALEGRAGGWLWLAVPVGAGLAGWAFGRRHAVQVARYPLVLGEIEAAWAAYEAGEEARHVYLDWVARWAPARVRPHLLRELRHLWRSHRGTAVLSWGLAAAGLLVDHHVAALGVVALAGARLGSEEPRWLDAWLGLRSVPVVRAVAVFLWLQPMVLVWALRSPAGVPGWELAAAVLATLASLAAWRRLGPVVYLPAAVAVWGIAA